MMDETMMDGSESPRDYLFKHAFNSIAPVDGETPLEDAMMDDADEVQAQAPVAFDLIQSRDSVATDISDTAPSPSLLNASDLTPMESDSEREGDRGRSFTGASLHRVQQLQVHDGA